MQRCTVIIVTHQASPVLFATLEAALRQKQLAELLVVDNGNPPDILSRLQQRALTEPRLRVITGHGNIGLAKGCNVGAREATGEYLLLLKPDYLLPPDALVNLMHALETEPFAVLASGIIEEPGGKQQVGSRYLRPFTPMREVGKLLGFVRDALPDEIPETVHEVAAISSACIAVRAGDFKKIGGLDEVFLDQVQGIDVCARVQTLGGKVLCVPSVRITHLPPMNVIFGEEMLPRAQAWLRAKGLMRYYNKHFSETAPLGGLFLLNVLIVVRYALAMLVARKNKVTPNSVAAKRLMILGMGPAELTGSDELKGKIVLVTGATSAIGLCVVRRLIASGAAVLAMSRGGEIPYRHEQLRWIKGDLSDHNVHLDGYLADIIVHCAPLWHLPRVMEMLQTAEVQRIIAFSSTSAFTKLLSNNSFEKGLVEKLQKAEAQLAEQASTRNIPYTIFRPTLTYGVGLDVGVTTLAKLIGRFSKLYVYPPAFGRRQPVHVDDLADAVLRVVNNPETHNKAYNLSGGEVLTFREMLEKLFVLMGKKPRIRDNTMLPFALDMAGWILRKKHINGEIARRMNDDLVFFHDDAKRDFGFHPRTFLSSGMRDIEGF
jgi:GT2 family glycosyltransferase/nucleoside-diphosphate-sugar epimerase